MKKTKALIVTLWVLYALQVIPVISWIVSEFGNALVTIFDDVTSPVRVFFKTCADNGIFPTESHDILIRLFAAYVLAFLVMIVILIIGRKEVFLGKSPLLLILPFIIEGLTCAVCWSDIIPISSDWAWKFIGCVFMLNIVIVIITQIYLIIKLVKATKQLKA